MNERYKNLHDETHDLSQVLGTARSASRNPDPRIIVAHCRRVVELLVAVHGKYAVDHWVKGSYDGP